MKLTYSYLIRIGKLQFNLTNENKEEFKHIHIFPIYFLDSQINNYEAKYTEKNPSITLSIYLSYEFT